MLHAAPDIRYATDGKKPKIVIELRLQRVAFARIAAFLSSLTGHGKYPRNHCRRLRGLSRLSRSGLAERRQRAAPCTASFREEIHGAWPAIVWLWGGGHWLPNS